MFCLEGFQPPLPPPFTTTPRSPISQFVFFPTTTTCQIPHLSAHSIRTRNDNRPFASTSRSKDGNSLLEIGALDEDFQEEEDDDGDEEFFGGDDEEEMEEGEVFIPLRGMKEWLENKPSGFGEGKLYDTPIEDKLLEEMEQSRKAQLANINKLKNNPGTPSSTKEEVQKPKAAEVLPTGIRVRLLHLPKKRNIHRDLQVAFKGVPGLINIIPAVLGNKKTRDPICKGHAFVYFKSEVEAYRFVQIFSSQSITFGKIQKQIKCEIVNSKSSNTASEVTQVVAPSSGEDSDADVDNHGPSLESSEEIDKYDGPNADTEEASESTPLSEPSGNGHIEPKTEPVTKSSSLERKEKVKKKKAPKRKEEKVPKLSIPGSANRLKIKEKSLLTDVFSKYGLKGKGTSVVKEQR